MINKWTLLLVLWGWSAALHAESYIVLFKNQPNLVVGKDAHKQQMQSKRATNSERIDKLLAALGANKSTVAFQDLWLVSGMEISLKSDEVSQVKKIDFVERVLVNQKRKYIAPVTREAPVVMDPGWGLRRLNVDLIRSTFPEVTGAGVRVGVIDTGIQSRHPEFEKKNKVVFKDFVNGIIHPYDDNGHGTHVSGTIAGKTTGVAPNVDLIVAKAFSATGSASDAWLLLAMQWMFDPDGNPETEDYPHVVSNSWGLDIPFDIVDLAEFEAFHRAIVAWVESDIIPVVAAGNSGASPNGMPGGFAEVLSIAAFDATNNIAEFSSRGPNYWRAGRNVLNVFKPDLAAPGVDIYSAMPGNSYEYMSGTSMATPHATGSIALVLQKTGRTTVADLKTILLYSMEPKFDFDFGSGIINPLAALQLLGEPSKRSLSR